MKKPSHVLRNGGEMVIRDGGKIGVNMKKPAGLSWNGHRQALKAAAPYVGRPGGGGGVAYKVAALQIREIERVQAKPKAEVAAELRAAMKSDGKATKRPR